MAKTSGGVRNSKWRGDIYTVDNIRKEYHELPSGRKNAVKSLTKKVSTAMYGNLARKSVVLDADGKKINVQFTKSGIEHIARDAMMTLSGKYMSKQSMIHIDGILSKSKYVPTSHEVYKGRNDGKTMFFKYKDREGRGLYFKVAKDNNSTNGNGRYYLYSVIDK